MLWGNAVSADGGHMFRRGVAGIAFPTIYGMDSRQLTHDLVPLHLRENRGRRDGKGFLIALDDAGAGAGQDGRPVAVDEGMGWILRQGVNGAAHGKEAGLQDVDGIDFRRRGPGQRENRDFLQLGGNVFARRRAQFLGIIKTPLQ